MNMRFTCISAISAFCNYLPPTDTISFFHTDTFWKEMCYHAIFMLAVTNNDMVSSHIRCGTIDLSLCDNRGIWKVTDRRNDNTICRSQNIFCKAEV